MRIALFGDIHANLEALNAVLEDAKSQGCEQWVCLGAVSYTHLTLPTNREV